MSKQINLDIEKNNGELKLKMKTPEALERFFQQLATDQHGQEATQESEQWTANGTQAIFYKNTSRWRELNSKLNDATMRKIGITAYSDYGTDLIRDRDAINIAPIRTKGISQGVTLKCNNGISASELEIYTRQLAEIAKILWTEFIAKQEIKATITFEL